MHVGLTVPAVFSVGASFGLAAGALMLAWGMLIAVSTLFTKQHYILDALAGAFLGILTTALVFFLLPG
jgi:membrane-associated phospholipid phosphatase